MTPTSSSSAPRPRRALLLGSAAALGLAGAVLAFHPATAPIFGALTPAFAQSDMTRLMPPNAQRPSGFADVVEVVKPAVVSVRVRGGGGPQVSADDRPGPRFGDRGDPRFGDRGDPRFGDRGDPRFGDRGDPRDPRFGGPGSRREQPRQVQSQGSGFFISPDGFVVTNNHVVDGAREVEIVTDEGRTISARVVGTDERTDLALLKAEGENFPYVRLADRSPRVGDWVVAVGNPFGLGGTVTAGIVSARGRDIGSSPDFDFIQIDAPINRGNSGGPTFNVDGEVIGVNTAIFSPSGGSVGIGFAIPAETVRRVVEDLRRNGSVARGFIGVQIQSVTPEMVEQLGLRDPAGALVAEVNAGGPAQRAGIRPGDVIVAINGDRVRDQRETSRRIAALGPGVNAAITVLRNGREQTIEVALGQLPNARTASRGGAAPDEDRGDAAPEETQGPNLGFSLAPAGRGNNARGPGVVVTQVQPQSPAAEVGIREGDVILDVAGRQVTTPREVQDAIRAAASEGRRMVMIRVRSGDRVRFVPVPLARG